MARFLPRAVTIVYGMHQRRNKMIEQLKKARLAAGLKQTELAEKACIRRAATISDIEQGKQDPTLSTLKAIAEALDLQLALVSK